MCELAHKTCLFAFVAWTPKYDFIYCLYIQRDFIPLTITKEFIFLRDERARLYGEMCHLHNTDHCPSP